MTYLPWILGALALVSAAVNVWQWFAARRFPLHARLREVRFTPAVTVLKPLKGCDAHTEDCLRSWFQQDYAGPVQLLFAVASSDDPAAAVVEKLRVEFPARDAQLLVCTALQGANAKVAKLAQLALRAAHETWMISDADIRVPPDYLANAVAPLENPDTGLVFSFYRLANPTTLAMRWEAVAINADFWSQVLQGRALRPIDFALGAVMTTRRAEVERIGGFAALADCLADDYQLGHRITKTGKRMDICPVVVECWDPPQGWRAVWSHQLRWARTIRVCMPVSYFFSIIGNLTMFAVIALMTALIGDGGAFLSITSADGQRSAVMLNLATVGVLSLALRVFAVRALCLRMSPATWRDSDMWMALLKDLLQFAVWACAFLGHTVEWRGVRYRVQRDGTLRKLGAG